jgi:hypothetical protein
MTDQPEALRLADELERPVGTQSTYSAIQQAAAELRRLHAEVERAEAIVSVYMSERNQARDQIIAYRAEVERLRAELARLTKLPSPPPLWGKGCPVCGIGSQPGVYGFVCARGDCPTRVTCGGMK